MTTELTDGIVTRLRRSAKRCTHGNERYYNGPEGVETRFEISCWRCMSWLDAADEIERLRQEVQNLSDISDGWWQFHIGKISPEEMSALLQKADATAKRPIPGYYDADKRQNEEAN